MTSDKTIKDVRNEIEAVVTKINQHRPLVYRSLRQIAEQEGWTEDTERGKGSHRSFRQAGYQPVTVKCHGEGKELDAPTVRSALQELYRPRVNRILESTLDSAVLHTIDDLWAALKQADQVVYQEKVIACQAIRDQSDQALVTIQQDIDDFLNQELKAADAIVQEQIQEQIQERLRAHTIVKQEAISQSTRAEFDRSIQRVAQLEQDLEQQVSLTQERQKQIDDLQTQLCQVQRDIGVLEVRGQTREQEFQQLQDRNCSLEQDLAQGEMTRKSLTQQLQANRSEMQQLRHALVRVKRRQRWKDLSLWLGLGFGIALAIAGVRALATSTELPVLSPTSPQTMSE